MGLNHEIEVELTNLWSLLHAAASGCISIAMWEGIKFTDLGNAGTFVVYTVASIVMVHAVRLHRKAVQKKMSPYTQAIADAEKAPDVS